MARKKIRLFIDGEVLTTPHFSGIGHYTLELVRALDRQLETQKDIKIYLGIYFKQLEKARSFGLNNVKIVPTPFSMRISNGLKIRGIQPFLDLFFGKKIYLFPNFSSWPLLWSKSLSIVYDLSYEKYPEYAEPRNQVFLSNEVKKTTQRSSRIITISENSKREISDFYDVPARSIDVLYPAVDTALFYRRTAKEVKTVQKKYNLEGGYILFVGNIEPRKNLKNLLLAYEKLDERIRHRHPLVLVGGKGWQDEEIYEIIQRLVFDGNKILRPTKYVDDQDLPALYSGASLFVYPSIYEGFGIPPVEAMACGAPVIASDNSSLPEAVGDAGLLVDALSVNDIAAAMESVFADEKLQHKLTKHGADQVAKFSWDESAAKLIESARML